MKIQKTNAKIMAVKDLGESAREITMQLAKEVDIVAGSFVNIFITIDGKVYRRAYSIASDYKNKKELKIAVRKKRGGAVSPYFWDKDIIGTELEIMGPLGLNTVDKMHSDKVFLVGFGIGVSVTKALTYALQDDDNIKEIHIITGNRSEKDILYHDFFDSIEKLDSRITLRYVVTKTSNKSYPYVGFVQEHISDYNFSNSDVYVCGQTIACDGLVKQVKAQSSDIHNTHFFIEAFH